MDRFSVLLPLHEAEIEVLIYSRKIPFFELSRKSDVLYVFALSWLLLAFIIVCIVFYKRVEMQKTGLAKAVIGVTGAVFLLWPLLRFCIAVGYLYFSSMLKGGNKCFVLITVRPYLVVVEVVLILVYVLAKRQAEVS